MKHTMTNAEDLQYVRALLHGDSGSGKTYSIRSLSEKYTLVALCERSPGPLRTKKFPVEHMESFGDVKELYAAFANPDKIQDDVLKERVKSCRTLVIDSLSEVGEMCMQNIIEVSRPNLVKERTKDKRSTPENTYAELATMEDYGLYRKRMLNLISAFCHLPKHIIFTSLSAWHKDKSGGETIKTPNLPGKSAVECVAYFDLVFYMKNQSEGEGKVSRAFQTYSDGMVLAKGDESLDPLELPDWTSVFKKYLGKGGKNGKS